MGIDISAATNARVSHSSDGNCNEPTGKEYTLAIWIRWDAQATTTFRDILYGFDSADSSNERSWTRVLPDRYQTITNLGSATGTSTLQSIPTTPAESAKLLVANTWAILLIVYRLDGTDLYQDVYKDAEDAEVSGAALSWSSGNTNAKLNTFRIGNNGVESAASTELIVTEFAVFDGARPEYRDALASGMPANVIPGVLQYWSLRDAHGGRVDVGGAGSELDTLGNGGAWTADHVILERNTISRRRGRRPGRQFARIRRDR